MTDAVAERLLAGGLPGIVILVLGWVCWKLYESVERARGEAAKAMESRVADAQKVAADALEREEKWQGVLTELTAAIERHIARRSE